VNHWVCVSSNDSKTINLLDSLSVKITWSLLLQIASVFKPDKAASKLYINLLCVHQQSSTLDCGLFTIAFAVEVCRGNNPRETEFVQTKMRDHLLICLELRRFELFPRKKCQLKNKLAPLRCSAQDCIIFVGTQRHMISRWLNVVHTKNGSTFHALESVQEILKEIGSVADVVDMVIQRSWQNHQNFPLPLEVIKVLANSLYSNSYSLYLSKFS